MSWKPWSERRREGYNYLIPLWEQGLTGKGALDWLRQQDLGYRMKEFYTDWASVSGYLKGQIRAQFQAEDRPPDVDLLAGTDVYVDTPYTYAFSVSGQDAVTGKTRRTVYHIGMDEYGTVAQARAELEAAISNAPDRYLNDVRVGVFAGGYYLK